MLNELEAPVAARLAQAVSGLARADARIIELPLEMLGDDVRIHTKGRFSPVEAFVWHEKLIERRGQDYDPRVRTPSSAAGR